MQFSAIVNKFIVKTLINSAFTNDLKRKDMKWKRYEKKRNAGSQFLLSLQVYENIRKLSAPVIKVLQ